MKLNYLFTLLLIIGCSKQSAENQDVTDSLQMVEAERANDEPAEDGSNVLTNHDFVLREVDEIDHDPEIKRTEYVYLFDGAVVPFTISYNQDSRGEQWFRKAYHEIVTDHANFAISYYYDKEARLIFGRHIRSSLQNDDTLIIEISYTDDGEILHFWREDLTATGTTSSEEFSGDPLYEDFEGIFRFPDARKMVSAPGMIEKEFYIGAREDYFDAGDGEIENADAPKSVRSEHDNVVYEYTDLVVKVSEDESGQTVTYKGKTESENKVPLPANAYFKGRWGNALIFEVRSESGLQLQVFDLPLKDFVLIRNLTNMKITADKKFLVFTSKVTEKDVEYVPLCTPEHNGQQIRLLEVIHLDRDYAELRYGQVYCYLYNP